MIEVIIIEMIKIGLIKDLVDHLIMEYHVILGGIVMSIVNKLGINQSMIIGRLINLIMEHHIILCGRITIIIKVTIIHIMIQV